MAHIKAAMHNNVLLADFIIHSANIIKLLIICYIFFDQFYTISSLIIKEGIVSFCFLCLLPPYTDRENDKKVANSHLRVIYMLNIPSSSSVKGKYLLKSSFRLMALRKIKLVSA